MIMSISEGDKTMMMVEDAWLNFVQNKDKPVYFPNWITDNPVYYTQCQALIKAERKTELPCLTYYSNTANSEARNAII